MFPRASAKIAVVSLFLSAVGNAAVTLTSFKTEKCPLSIVPSLLPDGSVSIVYSDNNGKFPSIGPSIPKEQNSVSCTVDIALNLNPNQKLSFQGIEVEAPFQLEKGVRASISTNFLWSYAEGMAKLDTPSITGPLELSEPAKFNITMISPHQINCQLSGPFADAEHNYKASNIDPIDTGFTIRTRFDLSGPGSGRLSKDGVIKQLVKLGYSEPCPDYRYDTTVQRCYIDRFDTYVCYCGGEQQHKAVGPCEKWKEFPPLPFY